MLQEIVHAAALQVGISLFLLSEGRIGDRAVIMSGEQQSVIGEFHDGLMQTFVHFFRVAAGKVAPATPVDEHGIAGNQDVLMPEALASGGVARCQNALKVNISNRELVPVLNFHDIFVLGLVIIRLMR